MLRAGLRITPGRWQACAPLHKSPFQQPCRRLLSSTDAEQARKLRLARAAERPAAAPSSGSGSNSGSAKSGSSSAGGGGGGSSAGAASSAGAGPGDGGGLSARTLGAFALLAVASAMGIYTSHEVKNNPNGSWAKGYKGSVFDGVASWVYDNLINIFPDIDEPYSGQVIPAWESGHFYGEIPPGTPPNPLLILDLDKTLITSTHDAKFGWRHVKRPFLKKFLDGVTSQGYYEVVIFSENPLDPDIKAAVDPNNMCHWLGPDAGELRNNQVLKRLDVFPRPLHRIIVVDDSKDSSSLCQDNTLLIKPFTDVYDKNDRELLDLLVFLQAIVHDQVNDFPRCFDDLSSREVSGVVTEYRMRVSEAKREQLAKRNRGLGKLLRGGDELLAKDAFDDQEESLISKIVQSSQTGAGSFGAGAGAGGNAKAAAPVIAAAIARTPTKADLSGVGAGAITAKGSGGKDDITARREKLERRKGGLAHWIEDREKGKQEAEMARQQAMNEQYGKELKMKAEAEAAAARRKEMSGQE